MPSPLLGKKNVVIIGGGAAGIFTAYLLKKFGSGCLDVTVLDQNARVGGHTLSRGVSSGFQTVNIDGGAQFFSETAQPDYCALLKAEGIFWKPGVIIERDVGVTLWNATTGKRLFRVPASVPEIFTSALNDPKAWLNFTLLTMEATALHFFSSDWSVRFGDWLDKLNFLNSNADSDAFKADVVRPLMYQFGLVDPDELDDLSAKFVVYYYVMSLPWEGGLAPFRVYNSGIGLDGILQELINNYALAPIAGSAVQAIVPKGLGYEIKIKNKPSIEADEVVFAINPQRIWPLLPPDAAYDPVRDLLKEMKYVDVPVYVEESDTPTYMPKWPDWSVSNVLVANDAAGDPTNYMLTVWFGPMKTQPIAMKFFKSWGSPSLTPAPAAAKLEQIHELMIGTPEFIANREKLRASHQGNHHLWYTGGYLVDYDSQNACLRSASSVAFDLIYNCEIAPLLAAPAVSTLLSDLDAAAALRQTQFRPLPELFEEIVRRLLAERPDDPAVRAWIERQAKRS